MRPGGFAILPQPIGMVDDYGLYPNRKLVFWPYSKINSSHLVLGDRLIFLHAQFKTGFFKIGFPNPDGWIGCYNNGILFVKRVAYFPRVDYYDMGSYSECYRNSQYLELETLGPKVILEPGMTVSHQEEWVIFPDVEITSDEQDAVYILSELGLL